jgi:CRP-like cAMP-binding protein
MGLQVDRASCRRVLERIAPIDDAAWGELARLLVTRSLQRGERLLRAGEIARLGAFVCSGAVRENAVGADGIERAKSFRFEGDFTGSLADLLAGLDGVPSKASIEALEPTRLLCFDYRAMRHDLRAPVWTTIGRVLAEQLAVAKAQREHDLLTLDAEARWAALIARNPDLPKRVAQRHLASFLGITPEALSRLRRKIHERNKSARGGRP